VRKSVLPLSISCLFLSFLLLPVVKAGNTANRGKVNPTTYKASARAGDNTAYASEMLYDSLKLGRLGLSRQALQYAYKGLQKLVAKGLVVNPSVLTVCDFTQSSDNKRMYIIDVKKCQLLLNTYVAHGRNSGLSFAERFSNSISSLESSLGFYVTKNIYFGKHGRSLRLAGLERGFNDNAERRAVVVHGAPYIGEQRAEAAYMGRSFGCPAVPQYLADKVINLIKDGTCLFIYHPSRSYLHGSRILNG